MKWMEVNGASLRYELSGDGAETVLLVHELGGALDSWNPSMLALQKDFRVLRYDQRGFGQSEKACGTLDVDTMADDMLGLLDGLDLDAPCHIVGIALGSGIAIRFAAKYPDRVKSLFLASPATGVKAERRDALLARAASVEESGMRPVCESSLNNSYPDILRGDMARFEAYRLQWLTNDPFGFAAINRMLSNMNLDDDYAKVTCPALVVAGKHDGLRPTEAIEEIANAIPKGVYLLADTGHFMHVQTPDKFLELLTPFLKSA
jgi:3-oxoadipate enol-lactonase